MAGFFTLFNHYKVHAQVGHQRPLPVKFPGAIPSNDTHALFVDRLSRFLVEVIAIYLGHLHDPGGDSRFALDHEAGQACAADQDDSLYRFGEIKRLCGEPRRGDNTPFFAFWPASAP